jgi:hypothetical protein
VKTALKAILGVGLAGLLLVGAIWGLYRWEYPFGARTCRLPCMIMSLHRYAYAHDGWYPKEGKTRLDSLRVLLGDGEKGNYIGVPDLLAGISGNEEETRKRFFAGTPIDETVSSWVYFPGFRSDDDPQLAIIWERQQGICFNGSRADGHAVGFADGHHEQIPQARWPAFLKEQEALRQTTLAKRPAETGMNTPANTID